MYPSSNSLRRLIPQIALLSLALSLPAVAHAQAYRVLKSFGILSDVTGWSPSGQLVQGLDGTFYGVASDGEGNVQGTVFKIQPDGSGFAVLKWFTNSAEGATPQGPLALSGNTLYGTTSAGGGAGSAGTVFKLNTDGRGFTVLKNFGAYSYDSTQETYTNNDGANPTSGVAVSGTTLFGTTSAGGGAGVGTIFHLNTDGTGFSVMKSFSPSGGSAQYYPYTNSDGALPNGLIVSGTTLYGSTAQGGTSGAGTIFKINTNGMGFTLIKVFSNSPDAAMPSGTLVLADSTLYGVTSMGGTPPVIGMGTIGTVFKLNTDGSGFTLLKSFDSSANTLRPSGGLVLSGTTLYGTAVEEGDFGNGTIFKIDTSGSGFAVIHSFGPLDGPAPAQGVILAGGSLYGMTPNGGNLGTGSIFSLGTDGSSYTVLKSFNGYSDGAQAAGVLTIIGNTLYGTTPAGGISNNGTVFRVNTDGSGYTVLRKFTNVPDGSAPSIRLAVSGNTLYGTTFNGGISNCGTVFCMNTDGSNYTVLRSFTNRPDGATPSVGGLILSGNTLYGTTQAGGAFGFGSVFKLNTDGGGYAVLKSFTPFDAQSPVGGLISAGGVLYGTSQYGGTNGHGTVFKLNTNGTGFSVVYNLASVWYPYTGVTLSGNTLYGTTVSGQVGNGALFKVNTDGTGFVLLRYLINSADGLNPQGDLTLVGDTLYSTTENGGSTSGGTIFRMNTDGSGYLVLKDFNNSLEGVGPQAGLTLSGGVLYGTTFFGGDLNEGTVFALNMAPVITSQPQSVTVAAGTDAAFAVGAAGDTPLGYQWTRNSNTLSNAGNVSGATAATLMISNTFVNDPGSYQVFVSNGFGITTSAVATLTVQDLPLFLVNTNADFGFKSNQFTFNLAGPAGSNVVIYASTNLQSWTPLQTNGLTLGAVLITDRTATNYPKRFYRAKLE